MTVFSVNEAPKNSPILLRRFKRQVYNRLHELEAWSLSMGMGLQRSSHSPGALAP